MTEHASDILDDIDVARELLDIDVATDDVSYDVSYSLRAIAHVLLWTAEQQRSWQHKHADAQRAAEEW